jgi:nucleoside-diphosphate-sugar epimerase
VKVLVIGGTQFIGQYLVPELLKADHDVTILHRKPKHPYGKKVSNITCDRNDVEEVKQAIGGRRFEIVFDNVYDFQRGTTAAQVEAAVHSCGDRLSRYIFMSSISAYGDGLNHYEDDPLAPDDHHDPYISHKAMTERMLFRLHQRTGFPVVTFRPPFIYGPENNYYREQFFFDRLRANRPIILPGDGGRLMQFVYIKDLITAMMKAMTEQAASGEAFNIGNDRPVTQLELVQALAKAANKKLTIAKVPRDRIIEAGGSPAGDPAYFGQYFDLPPITEAMGKLKRMLKVQVTPFDQGLRETFLWYQRKKKPGKLNTEFEDKLIALAQNSVAIPDL